MKNSKILIFSIFFILIVLLLLLKQIENECIDQKTNEIIDTNRKLLNNHFQLYDNSETPRIFCSKTTNFSETFSVNELDFHLVNVLGFHIRNSKLIHLNGADEYLTLEILFQFVYFDFYRNQSIQKSNLVDMSSSRALIASYHAIDNNT